MKNICVSVVAGVLVIGTVTGLAQNQRVVNFFKKSPPPPPAPVWLSERIQAVVKQLEKPDDWELTINQLDGVLRRALQHKKSRLILVLWEGQTSSIRDENNIRFITSEEEKKLIHDLILPIITEKNDKKYFK